jgi:hypothetical protein
MSTSSSGRSSAKSFSFWRSAPARLPILENDTHLLQLSPRIYAFTYRECSLREVPQLATCATMQLSWLLLVECADEDRESWKDAVSHHKLSREYKSFLHDAARAVGKLRCPGTRDRPQLLLANLGPPWGGPTVCSMFGASILELGGWNAWERPPAVGTVPLDILLGVCQALFKWLHADQSHMAVGFIELPVSCHAGAFYIPGRVIMIGGPRA